MTKQPAASTDEPLEPMTDSVRVRAVLAIMSCGNLAAAAAEVGRSDRTLRRWMAEDEAFAAAVRRARGAAFSLAATRAAASSAETLETLIALSKNPDATSAQVSACKAILDYARSAVEVDDIGERLRALEAKEQEREARS